jgi:hypothetical protein
MCYEQVSSPACAPGFLLLETVQGQLNPISYLPAAERRDPCLKAMHVRY